MKTYKSKTLLVIALMAIMLSGCGSGAGEVPMDSVTAPQIVVEKITEGTEATEPAPAPNEQVTEAESILQLARECHEAEINNNKEVLREKSNVKEFIQTITTNAADEEKLTQYLYSEDEEYSFHSEYPMLVPTGYGEPIKCSDEEIKVMNDYVQLLYSMSEHQQGEVSTYVITNAYKVPIEYTDENAEIKEYEANIYILEANGEWKYDIWVALTAFVLNSNTN